jgi:hypothetical protein
LWKLKGLINEICVGAVHLKPGKNFRIRKSNHNPRWKTPGLHTYVSSEPSKIGCKAKYFVLLTGQNFLLFFKRLDISLNYSISTH